MKRLAYALAAAALAACATPAKTAGPTADSTAGSTAPAAVASAAPRKIICHTERPTGSNIPEQICRPADDRDADAAETQEAVRRVMQQQVQRGPKG